MAHNDYVREGGQWPPETVPTARDWATFDRVQSKGLHLLGGTTFTPSSPIILGGAGFKLAGNQGLIAGDVRTESGGRLAMGDDDYPEFAEGVRERTVMLPFGAGLRAPHEGPSAYEMSLDPYGIRFTRAVDGQKLWTIPSERLHQGATLDLAKMRFRVAQPHAGLPAQLPYFLIARAGLGHTLATVAYLSSTAAITANYGQHPVPTTGDAHYAGGAVQTMTMILDQLNVIDVATYSYFVVMSDEGGANALPGNIFHSLELHFTNITDLRPE